MRRKPSEPPRSSLSGVPLGLRPAGAINVGEIALRTIARAVETYVTITQDVNSKEFMKESVSRLLADPSFTASSMLSTLEEERAARRSSTRLYPTVIAEVWMACAYAVEAIHRVRREDYASAITLLAEAAHSAGYAEGACCELVLKYNNTHSPKGTRSATLKKLTLSAEKDARLKRAACQAYCAGLNKRAAAEIIHRNDVPLRLRIALSVDEIYRRLCTYFPGDAWKKRAIER